MKRRTVRSFAVSLLLTAVCLVPFLYILGKSFLTGDGTPTLANYYQIYLGQGQYLLRFWKSLALALPIAALQTVVSVLAGFGFAKCRFPLRRTLFFLLMVLMILPLQVTLVPNYMVLKEMGLLNTCYALVLPAIFVPLGTFIMTQSFQAIPGEVLEAARLDGCTTLGIILRVAVPINKSGLVCTALLSFLDGWNMVEQPVVYLESFSQYPFAVALASVPPREQTLLLAACVLVVLPPILLFAYYNRELVEGICIGGEK